MISVRSHLRLLSGNKWIAIGLFIFLACSPAKKASPAKDKQGNPPVVKETALPSKIDTVVWKRTDGEIIPDDKIKVPPDIKDKEVISENKIPTFDPKAKHHFTILALIPLKTNEIDTLSNKIPSSHTRFVQYYAGMQMAIHELDNNFGAKVTIDVRDIQADDISSTILKEYEKKPPNIILGPYKAEAIKYAAAWAKEHQSTLISPWISSPNLVDKNPYYIQLKAGLNAHYQLMNKHVRQNFPNGNIYVISKSDSESKVKNFNDSTKYSVDIKEKVISENELSTSLTPVLFPLMKEDEPTVFILPLSSFKDENYIYQFLRRIALEKENRTVYVYGLSKWLDLKSDILEYISTLNVRLTVSNFADQDLTEIKSFKRRYFDIYREFPTQEAMEGYDLVHFILRSLKMYGPHFQFSSTNIAFPFLETQFIINPVFKSSTNTDIFSADYFENQYVQLVEIRNNRYKLID